MFGGLAWLIHDNPLCGSREDGMLARLGRAQRLGAGVADVGPMILRGRALAGWVRAGQAASAENARAAHRGGARVRSFCRCRRKRRAAARPKPARRRGRAGRR